MKKLIIALIAIYAATMFVLGLVLDLREESQQVTALEALIIFVTSLFVFPLAYSVEQLSLQMGRWFSSAVGIRPCSTGQSTLLEHATLCKGIALCFGAFGIGALTRFVIRGEPPVLIGVTFLGFAIGMNAGILFVECLHRLRNRDR